MDFAEKKDKRLIRRGDQFFHIVMAVMRHEVFDAVETQKSSRRI